MVRAGSVGVILPTTAYILRLKPPPVRDMINAGRDVRVNPLKNFDWLVLSNPLLSLVETEARLHLFKGMIVALGSDFNPNAYCLSMPVVMHLACVNLRMSLPESLAAATINSAHSLGRSSTHGSIEVEIFSRVYIEELNFDRIA